MSPDYPLTGLSHPVEVFVSLCRVARMDPTRRRSMATKARDVMTGGVECIGANDTALDAAKKLVSTGRRLDADLR